MSSDRIYFSKEEQLFLMDMLEIDDPIRAAERFASILVEERADPTRIQEYLKKIMKRSTK